MSKPISYRVTAAVALGVVLLLGIGLIARVQGISLGTILGMAARPFNGAETVIATVNGDPITLHALERTKTALQATGTARDESEAYRQAMEHLVRETVLVQEARHRGFVVAEEEARAYWEQVKATAAQSPELARLLEEEAKASGLDERAFADLMVATYQEGLLIERLYQALAEEAPPPSTEEVDLYLAKQPGPHALVLIPIAFRDRATAQATFAELQTLATTRSPDELATLFDGYARRWGAYGPGEFVHQTFRFAHADELPDYARDALSKPEGSIGLFERADGSGVVYLVLKSAVSAAEEARALAAAQLSEERRMAHIENVTKQLVDQAKVRIFTDRLPLAAREALAAP